MVHPLEIAQQQANAAAEGSIKRRRSFRNGTFRQSLASDINEAKGLMEEHSDDDTESDQEDDTGAGQREREDVGGLGEDETRSPRGDA